MAPVIRGNSLYKIVDGPSWSQAEANSVTAGGHLITFNNKDELFWVQDIILSNPYNPKIGYFTGLNDARSEGNYEWSSGETSEWENLSDLIHRQNWLANSILRHPTITQPFTGETEGFEEITPKTTDLIYTTTS